MYQGWRDRFASNLRRVRFPSSPQTNNITMTLELKNIIKKDLKVFFSFYRAGNLYYTIEHEGVDYSFPVPLDDIGDATMLKTDKSIIMMRYIRKALDSGTFVKAN